MGKLTLAIIAALVPIVLWGAYFRYKNPRNQSVLEAVKIFVFGMLSIVPMLIFHRWFLGEIIPGLVEKSAILSIPFVHAIIELVLTLIFIIFFMALFAFIQSVQIRLIYKLPWKESFHKIYKRGYSLAPIILIFALFVVVDAVTNLGFQYSFLLSVAGSTIIFAILEEYFKYIINPFLVYKKLNSVGTAMVDALYVGLAFAFVENVLFFFVSYQSKQFWDIVIFRSLVTTLLHVCASGLLGYFYGRARFSKSMLTNYEIEKSSYKKHLWLKGFLGKDTMFKSVSVTHGFFLAAFVHALFNLLLSMGQRTIAASMVAFLAIVVVMLLKSKAAQVQYGLIGSQAMPEADYEKLRMQVSVLQHLKEIRKTRMDNEYDQFKSKQKLTAQIEEKATLNQIQEQAGNISSGQSEKSAADFEPVQALSSLLHETKPIEADDLIGFRVYEDRIISFVAKLSEDEKIKMLQVLGQFIENSAQAKTKGDHIDLFGGLLLLYHLDQEKYKNYDQVILPNLLNSFNNLLKNEDGGSNQDDQTEVQNIIQRIQTLYQMIKVQKGNQVFEAFLNMVQGFQKDIQSTKKPSIISFTTQALGYKKGNEKQVFKKRLSDTITLSQKPDHKEFEWNEERKLFVYRYQDPNKNITHWPIEFRVFKEGEFCDLKCDENPSLGVRIKAEIFLKILKEYSIIPLINQAIGVYHQEDLEMESEFRQFDLLSKSDTDQKIIYIQVFPKKRDPILESSLASAVIMCKTMEEKYTSNKVDIHPIIFSDDPKASVIEAIKSYQNHDFPIHFCVNIYNQTSQVQGEGALVFKKHISGQDLMEITQSLSGSQKPQKITFGAITFFGGVGLDLMEMLAKQPDLKKSFNAFFESHSDSEDDILDADLLEMIHRYQLVMIQALMEGKSYGEATEQAAQKTDFREGQQLKAIIEGELFVASKPTKLEVEWGE